MTTPPSEACLCVHCGTCYHAHGGGAAWGHEWRPIAVEATSAPEVTIGDKRAAPVLIDTATAVLISGRTEGTIYRWATERRLTRYGTKGHGNALWDHREIPTWDGKASPRPKPPAVKPQNFQDKPSG